MKMHLNENPQERFKSKPAIWFKRIMDLGISSLLLILLFPCFLLIAFLIKISSSGNALFSQTRIGMHGKPFQLYKFRSMIQDAESLKNSLIHHNIREFPAFKCRKDPRITWIGKIIRRFSIDELPQLWNVIKGDMSLVGPRPPLPEEVEHYSKEQHMRLTVPPGITCIWQIRGRADVSFAEQLEMDLYYIKHFSPMLDVKILLKTIPAVIKGKGAY
jgi:exopolysaccharide biosynthesis polyprenyl glycosylphosphotransferase